MFLGAFGAHTLKGRIEPELLTAFDTGVRYHMYHAVALLAVARARLSGARLQVGCSLAVFSRDGSVFRQPLCTLSHRSALAWWDHPSGRTGIYLGLALFGTGRLEEMTGGHTGACSQTPVLVTQGPFQSVLELPGGTLFKSR